MSRVASLSATSSPEPCLSDGQREHWKIAIDEAEVESLFFDAPPAQIPNKKNKPKELRTELDAEDRSRRPSATIQLPAFEHCGFLINRSAWKKQQSYYLDHPKMGILVTIKSHEVEITNPPEEIEPALDAQQLLNRPRLN